MLTILLLLQLIVEPVNGAKSFSLNEYTWKNRVVLVMPDKSKELLQRQLRIFGSEKIGMMDRDLVLLYTDGNLVEDYFNDHSFKLSSDFIEKFPLHDDEFAVVLIGKDGGTKFRSREIVSLEKLFGIIDAMPMRRAEMRAKSR